MKRFLPVVILFLIAIGGYYFYTQGGAFSKSASTQSEESDHPEEVEELGIISSLGNIVVPGSGTHLLTKSDKKTILLVGLGANLDEYLQKNVKVEGRLSQSPSGKALIQVLRIEPVQAELASTVSVDPKEALKWVTFMDEALGMTFQRRQGWQLEQTKTSVIFSIPSLATTVCEDVICPTTKLNTIKIERVSNDTNAPLASFTGDAKMSSKNLIGPHKLIGYKRYQADKGTVTFVVAREKYVFILTYTPGEPGAIDSSANDFFSLISSFDFIPVKQQ